jgi:hypothetical protein
MGKFCVYVTYHATGKFYVGKGVTTHVKSGKYKGSGKILHCAFKKYPKQEWITEIVQTFETENEAYIAEEYWVDNDLINDPDCLNLIPGGKGWKSEQVIRQNAIMWQDASYATKMSDLMSERWRDSEFSKNVRSAASSSQKKRWADPEYRVAMTAISNKTADKTFRNSSFQSKLSKRAWAKQEYREHQAMLSRERMKRPEYKASLREGIQRKWQDPEYRAKMTAERSARLKNTQWITKDGVAKQVPICDVDAFLADGWKRGMK